MLSLFYPFTAPSLLVLFFMMIVSHSCRSQNETAAMMNNAEWKTADNNNKTLPDYYIYQVDSIGHTKGIAGHFARIYTASMGNINMQLRGKDSGTQAFIKKFEVAFIGYFLLESFAYQRGQPVGSVWNCYFSNLNARSWQLTLIGINAHINGDIWKGLVNSFSAEEIKRYKKDLLSFQSAISKTFQPFFEDLKDQSAYLRFINSFTKGSAKKFGGWLVYKWRLRQVDLAIMYYKDREKFAKKLAAVNRKKNVLIK